MTRPGEAAGRDRSPRCRRPAPSATARPFRAVEPGAPGRPGAVGRQGREDDPEDDRARRQQRDLRRVADGDREQDERDRADEGDRQDHDPGRDPRETAMTARSRLRPGPVARRSRRKPTRRCGGRPPRCTRAAAASSPRRPRDRARRTRRRGTPAPSSIDSNVQKQWTTRILNPPRRNGPSRRLHGPYSGRSPRRRETSSRP